MITSQDDFNLTDANFFATGDPYELFRRLRAEDPVHLTKGKLRRSFWSVTKHEDALSVYRRASTDFGNCAGSSLPTGPEVEAAFTAADGSLKPPGAGLMMVASDGGLHQGLRKAFNRLFLPRAIKQFEDSGRRLVSEIIDEVLPRGRCEFVSEVASRLPMVIICEMMDIPRKDWQLMFDLVNRVMGPEDPEYQVGGSAAETRQNAWMQAFDYCLKLALERRGGSGTDLLSIIANGEVLGRPLTDEEIGHNGFMFVIAGFDTTRNAIAGGVLELIREPEQMRRLRENRSFIPTAVEEFLRWTSPITHSMRVALRDAELRGRRIHRGDWVAVWNASADRDEDAFANPDRFDIGRTPNEHVALAYGEHFCLGAHLARLEIRLIIEEIVNRMSDLELDGKVERLASNLLAGIKRLPVKFTPRRAAAA
jgi:cytochrome P450